MAKKADKTTVGSIDREVLAYTAGKDVVLDRELIEVDCLGTAAHVIMLAGMPVQPRIFSAADVKKVRTQLGRIVQLARVGKFKINLSDQDVHLAVERTLTRELGELGKKVHTGRSRNDQVAVDLRLYTKQQLIGCIRETVALADAFLKFGRKHVRTPMVGRTHMQPAMPSSVALWSTAFTEALLDDLSVLENAFAINDQCPLGSAAGYGVPLPIDREKVSRLLGFARPCHNVLHASNARGKTESLVLNALSQLMITLSRAAQDLMLYTLPEFGYFKLPEDFGTGSSIMPNKNNPDVLELIRARSSTVLAQAFQVASILKGAPSGYNRDLQEAKEPLLEGFRVTRASVRVLTRCVLGLTADREKLKSAFSPGVFATDRALELVGEGMPFRDAYHHVKENLQELEKVDPEVAQQKKTHLGAASGLDFAMYAKQLRTVTTGINQTERKLVRVTASLLGDF